MGRCRAAVPEHGVQAEGVRVTERPALGDAVVVGWPLRHVTVRLRHGRIHADDCVDCETRTGQLDHIERELQFDGELTEEQRVRLLKIAEHCPVHRMLNSEVHITTTENAQERTDGRDAETWQVTSG
jgi:hypothetical protein